MLRDPFGAQARQYLLSRPTYPSNLISHLLARVKPHRRQHCLDIACGSGQLTLALTPYFSHIHGIDRSQAQLSQAPSHPNVTYETIENASNLSQFSDNVYDCVTIAQAFHWMESKPSLNEFHRVLKPEGTLGVIGYGICKIENEDSGKTMCCDLEKAC